MPHFRFDTPPYFWFSYETVLTDPALLMTIYNEIMTKIYDEIYDEIL